MPKSIPSRNARVLVPLDLSTESADAFEHALKVALVTRGTVVPLHVHDRDQDPTWAAMPRVRDVLIRWGVLSADAGPTAFEDLGISVRPHEREARRPEHAIEVEVAVHEYDLVVMHSGVRQGLDRFLTHSTSLGIARRVPSAALLLSARTKPLVERGTGMVNLRHVLIPLGDPFEAQISVDTAVAFARSLGVERAHGTLFHVGDGIPAVNLPEGWTWDTRQEATGGIANRVVEVSDELDSDLIVMASRGHDSLRDALFGSVTERVAPGRTVRCSSYPSGRLVRRGLWPAGSSTPHEGAKPAKARGREAARPRSREDARTRGREDARTRGREDAKA
jgi:nucleotide-binding universal stress UspA family protein